MAGFFESLLDVVTTAVEQHFHVGSIIGVKMIRKYLGIPPGDRSSNTFLSRVLQVLEHRGILAPIENSEPWRYVVVVGKARQFPLPGGPVQELQSLRQEVKAINMATSTWRDPSDEAIARVKGQLGVK